MKVAKIAKTFGLSSVQHLPCPFSLRNSATCLMPSSMDFPGSATEAFRCFV